MTTNGPGPAANDGERPLSILPVLVRRRWFFLGPFFALGFLAYAVANLIPLQYSSSAFIIVEQQKIPEQYVTPNVLMTLQRRLDSMTQQILSRTRLQRFIEELGLYTPERKRMPMDDVVDLMRQRVSVELVQTTDRQADVTGFRIHFSDRDPFMARRVTDELTSLFIEQDIRERTSQSQQTTAFLESQLQDASNELSAEEEKLREYKLGHLGELPDQLESNLTILGSLEAQLQASTSALDRADQQRIYFESMRSQREALKVLARPDSPEPDSAEPPRAAGSNSPSNAERVNGGTVPGASLELAQTTVASLWKQLSETTAKFTDRHPEVIRLKKEIADWESTVNRLRAERAGDVELDSRLKAVLAEIEAEKRESAELRRRINDVQIHVGQVPVREQELAELTRVHDNAQKQFQSLLQKKQGSELATNLEERQGGERFRLLDPATLPKKPQGRSKIIFAGWALAAATGAGLTFLREMRDLTVHKQQDLESYRSIPILTRIPTVRPEGEMRWKRLRRNLEVAVVSGMLLMCLATGAQAYLQR